MLKKTHCLFKQKCNFERTIVRLSKPGGQNLNLIVLINNMSAGMGERKLQYVS